MPSPITVITVIMSRLLLVIRYQAAQREVMTLKSEKEYLQETLAMLQGQM